MFRHHLRGRASRLLGISVPPFAVPLKMKQVYHRFVGDSSLTRSTRRFAALLQSDASHRRAFDTNLLREVGECRLILFNLTMALMLKDFLPSEHI